MNICFTFHPLFLLSESRFKQCCVDFSLAVLPFFQQPSKQNLYYQNIVIALSGAMFYISLASDGNILQETQLFFFECFLDKIAK